MNNTEILKSFETQNELNSKIWNKKGNKYEINPEVRKKLLEVSNLFIDFPSNDSSDECLFY